MTDFFIADTHFGHKKILDFCAEQRPFKTIEDHDKFLIDSWNSAVTEEDTVYVLGDFELGGVIHKWDRVKELLSKLNGEKVLVMGNHDVNLSAQLWEDAGFYDALPMLEYKGCLLTHIPIDPGEIKGQSKRGRYLANIHGHLHDEGNTEELLKSGRFCVSAELMGLTPMSWETVWYNICNLGGKYQSIEDSSRVVIRQNNEIHVKEFDSNSHRIKNSFISLKPNVVYNKVSEIFKHGCIGIYEDDISDMKIVKEKHFIGVTK